MAWKNYEIHVADGDDYGPKATDKLVALMKNRYRISRTEAFRRIFFKGVRETFEAMDIEETCEELGEVKRLLDSQEWFMALEAEIRKRQVLERAYRKLGPEKFIRMARERGADLDDIEFMIEELQVTGITSWYDKAKRWMINCVQVEGEIGVHEVKKKAVNRGILTDPAVDQSEHDREWRNMKTCASELGMTSREHRGYWRAVADSDDMPIQ